MLPGAPFSTTGNAPFCFWVVKNEDSANGSSTDIVCTCPRMLLFDWARPETNVANTKNNSVPRIVKDTSKRAVAIVGVVDFIDLY